MLRPTQWTDRISPPETFDVPSALAHRHGISPLKRTIDPAIGPEVVLVVHTPSSQQARRLAAYRRPDVSLAPRLARTPDGDVGVLLWYLQDEAARRRRGQLFESFLPLGAGRRTPYRELAAQSHLHFALTAPDGHVHGWLEIDNAFDLGGALAALEGAATLPAADLPTAASWAMVHLGVAALVETTL